MTNALLIAVVFSLGASVWIYTKLQRQSGYGNGKTALMGAGAAFVLIFVVVFSIAAMVLHR